MADLQYRVPNEGTCYAISIIMKRGYY